MPYIPQETRKSLLEIKMAREPHTGGELCFLLTSICKSYLESGTENFDRWGDIRNALASAWDAYLIDRFHAYERAKRKENGDL